MKTILGFFLISFFAPKPAFASSCAALVGTCDYYKCLSQELSCEAKDYPMSFGYHYCNVFDQERDDFTVRGQAFLSQIKTCLQRAIERRPIHSCGDVYAGAPADHLECYAQGDFCGLSFLDQGLIGETVFATMLTDPGFRGTAEQMSKSCGYLP